jgi:two-component system KDP operon response regulator KdpE
MNHPSKATTHAGAHPKARILLVDDDSSVREMLMRVLVGEGYLVLPAASGVEGLQIAAATQADLVLST